MALIDETTQTYVDSALYSLARNVAYSNGIIADTIYNAGVQLDTARVGDSYRLYYAIRDTLNKADATTTQLIDAIAMGFARTDQNLQSLSFATDTFVKQGFDYVLQGINNLANATIDGISQALARTQQRQNDALGYIAYAIQQVANRGAETDTLLGGILDGAIKSILEFLKGLLAVLPAAFAGALATVLDVLPENLWRALTSLTIDEVALAADIQKVRVVLGAGGT